MSNRKNYNSIVFLTTLSVYLGLVLAGGATPTVLAQAALTRDFDIKNEVVLEDDLDKKPDELTEEIEIVKNFKLAEAITNFVSDLKKLESIGKLNIQSELEFSHKLHYEIFAPSDFTTFRGNSVDNPWLQTAINQLIFSAQPENSDSIADLVPNDHGKNCRQTGVELEVSAKEFSLSFSFTKTTPQTAKLYAEEFNKVFVSQKLAQKNTVNLPVYENTKAHSENNQVFIVTRLPRASIDDMLAGK